MLSCFNKNINDNITIIEGDNVSQPDTVYSSVDFNILIDEKDNDNEKLIKLKNDFYTKFCDNIELYNRVLYMYNKLKDEYERSSENEINKVLMDNCILLTRVKKQKYSCCFMRKVMCCMNTEIYEEDATNATLLYNKIIKIEKNNIKIMLWKHSVNYTINNETPNIPLDSNIQLEQ